MEEIPRGDAAQRENTPHGETQGRGGNYKGQAGSEGKCVTSVTVQNPNTLPVWG